jgi:hypothetical protein
MVRAGRSNGGILHVTRASMVDFPLSEHVPADARSSAVLGRVHISAASIAGMVAASVTLGAMLMLAVLVYDESPWKLLRMMAAVVLGPDALEPDDDFSLAVVATGAMVHFALALLYSLAICGLVKDLPDAAAPWIGVAFGVGLYFANLYGFTHLFPWFAPMRTPDTLAAHAVFGIVAATTYRALASPASRESL